MSNQHEAQIDAFMNAVKATNAHETEFLQAVHEVAEAVIPFMDDNPQYRNAKILERMVEPERTLMFRVPWLDDSGCNHPQFCMNMKCFLGVCWKLPLFHLLLKCLNSRIV